MTSIIEKGTQTNLEISKIKRNIFNNYEMNDMEDLKNSIVTNGLITPISVIGPNEDGDYVLIAGERRLNIYTELYNEGNEKYKEMPVYVVGTIDMGETEQKLLIEASNLDTRDGYDKNIHYLNVIKLLKQYKAENKLSRIEYVKMREQYLKISPRYARFYETIFNKGSEELIDMVKTGEVSVSRAGRLASIPEDLQKSAIEELRTGANQDEVVEKYRNLNKENSSGKKKNPINDYEFTDLDEDFDSFDDFSEGNHFDDDFENTDFDDIDFNGISTDFLNTGSSIGFTSSKPQEDTVLNTVLQWCKKILKVTEPTDEQWEVIEACKKVAEHFH